MNRNPEARNLPELMLGHQVFVEYLKGPDITPDRLDRVVEEGGILKGQPEARTAAFYLHGVSPYGIEVTREPEGEPERFIPWGAVLGIYGWPREELLEDAQQGLQGARSERTDENGPT